MGVWPRSDRYFEGSLISDRSLRRWVFSMSCCKGRLGWCSSGVWRKVARDRSVVELGAYNITYVPRNVIKGQVLADFLNEIPVGAKHIEICSLIGEEAKLEEWTLYANESSSLKGVDAELILIDPTGVEYTYAIRLKFPSTNNEAIISGLDSCSTSLVDVTGIIHVGTSLNVRNGNVNDGTIPSIFFDSGNAVKEVVSPIAVDEIVTKEKPSPLMETTNLGSYPPLPTQGTTTAGATPGNMLMLLSIRAISEQFVNTAYSFFLGKRVAYPIVANYVRNTWGKYGLVRSMFSASTGLFSFQFSSMKGLNSMLENGSWFIRNNPLILRKWHPDVNLLKEDVGTVLVWIKLNGVPVTAFSEDGLSAIATKLGTPLMLDSYTSDMCMQSWGKSSYARAMIVLRADVELKDNIVEAMPKITGEGYYTCNIRVEYEWKPPRCACCKVFGHVQEECPKNIGTGAIKNLKKASQTPKGIPVGQKIGFKPKQVFQLVSKKSTMNTWGKKMNNLKSTKEVSKSNPFEVPTSVDNDVDLGKLRFMDDDGNPIVHTGIMDSDSEVKFLLEQWRDSYPDNYDYDLYDDDMYENHDMFEHLQSICDDLDITETLYLKNNNEAEYEALLAGLRIAQKMKVHALKVKVKKHASLFEKFPIENIPRNQYQKADVLSKLTSIAFNHLTKEVLVEVLNAKSVDAQEISTIVEEEEDNGMTPIIKCLEEVWLADENEARTLWMKISQYVMEEGWGLNILGPLPKGPGKLKFIIISIDYYTKWMEAKSFAKITGKEVKKFIWENIVYKFGLPRVILTDNGTQLVNGPFKSWCEKWKINTLQWHTRRPTIWWKGLTRLCRERLGWVEELANILWAHRTMLKTSNGETSFSLTYGREATISAEIGMETYRTIQFNVAQNKEKLCLNLDL
ncbi:retrotransposon protein, putative, ty1-copia subclass [Tanacetum coccineum]|uniref:Retrotransposon protein, putative, ty1-copia subclass n=1 Tax=Tanacetum coccineum TaxID=301880 RepID=A0ABQ4YXF6_9ASTR